METKSCESVHCMAEEMLFYLAGNIPFFNTICVRAFGQSNILLKVRFPLPCALVVPEVLSNFYMASIL